MKKSRVLAIICSAVMAFSLAGCGKDDGGSKEPEKKGYSGTYDIIKAATSEGEMDYYLLNMVEMDESYIIFNEDGTGEIFFGEGEVEGITYKDDGTMKFDVGDGDLTYEFDGDVVVVSFGELYDDMVLTFALRGSEALEEGRSNTGEVIETTPLSAFAADWWVGDWYGWWTIFDGDGKYEEVINEAWDSCVFIEEDASKGTYLLSIWDETYNDFYENCLAEVDLVLTEAGSEYGALVSTGEEDDFFWGESVLEGEWYIDPVQAGFDNMFIIDSYFVDADGDYCEYGVVLTKMGYEWNTEATYAPDYYESYFLPLMEENLELPVVFEP